MEVELTGFLEVSNTGLSRELEICRPAHTQ
jgi:hypothetical protein